MKTNPSKSYKWAYLPFVFSSAAILATSVTAAPGGSQQYKDAKQVNSINHEYVGGSSQAGISITDGGDVGLEFNTTLSETANSRTGAGLWADFDLSGDDEGLKGRGVNINHAWVSRDKAGRATHVNKALFAYDRNANGHDKATVGYGQENENLFWDVHASKGLSGSKNSRKIGTRTVSDKAYDYGIGGNVGTFIKGSNIRVRAGLDHEWGDNVGAGESTARNTTLSAGIEKFFQGTPHSLALDVAASERSGGLKNNSDDTDVNGRLTYRYDFGGASIYQPDRRYKRVRVEVPGKAVAARYKTVPTYTKKTIKKPYKQLVKSTVALEGQTFFKLNSSKLIPSAQARLKQIATEIRRNGYKGSIRITGNTCGLGDPVYDQRLSEQRARAVRAFLIKNGFNANHLVARGLGKGHPKYPNTPEQGFKNRRVDIEYVSERKSYKTGYRTETQNVRTGTRNVLIAKGKPGTPRVIWRTEAIPTSPAWIKRAMRNNITHNRNVNTYTSTDSVPTTPTNVAPVAVNDVQSVSCSNTPITINVLGNDSDKDGDTLTITSVQNGQYGTTKIVGNQVVYTPNGSGCGKTDSFEYTISDGKGHTTTATVKVDMADAVNVAPVAKDDSATTMQGQPVTLTTLSNDSDADGDTLTITNIQNPAHGTAVVSANGQGIIYTPNAGFVGTETFTYTISDGNGHTVTATETVVVKAKPIPPKPPTNVAPVAVNDVQSVSCSNTPITIDVIGNDTDADNDQLTITSVNNGQYGTTKIVGNKVVYTPNGSGCGKTDSFEYTISDGKGHTATATVKVNMAGTTVNVAPVAKDDSATTMQGQPVTLTTLSNDSDADGDTLTITDIQKPAHGTAVISADGKGIVYTPDAGFVGTETFTYTISDGNGHTATATETVIVKPSAPTNVAPIAVDDMATAYCDAVTIKVLDNDSDADNDVLSILSLSDPSLGTAVIQGNTIVYTPVNLCGTGIDTFSYTISDGNGHTATASIKVDVKGSGGCTTGCRIDPINVKNDTANTKEGVGITIDVLANDDSGLMITGVNVSNNSYIEIVNGKLSYLPNDGFSGTDNFSYIVKDTHGQTAQASVTVSVSKKVQVNLGPDAVEDAILTSINKSILIDVLANDTDPENDSLEIISIINAGTSRGGTATIENGKIRFISDGTVGSFGFYYNISDGHGGQDVAGLSIGVTDPNDGNNNYPNVNDETVTTSKGVSILVDVLANDYDVDGDTLVLDNISGGVNGTIVKVGKKIRYTPNPNYVGTDTFWYGVHDSHGHSVSGKTTVIVTD